MANDWSEAEVEAGVADYFAMLQLDLSGRGYNKTEHRRALMEHLNNRSNGSVERKHQNISAVLIEMGIPYINGYKPLYNYQRALIPDAVRRYLMDHPDIQEVFEADATEVPVVPSVSDILAVLEQPPEPESERRSSIADSGNVS